MSMILVGWNGRETFQLRKCEGVFRKGLSRAEIGTIRSKDGNGEKFPVPERCQRRMNGYGTQLKGLKMVARKVYYGNI